jgi:DNA invertase Pin-like site-specific DNA recombinase
MRAADDNGDSAELATWLKARVVDTRPARRMRLAWMGRTSDDEVQDPTISLPRQLRSCHAVLTEGMDISLFFWDVETSRKELGARGTSTAWRNFDIDIPRDGGIGDLLEEAQRPDRRFDGVICESIDRIARMTYRSTKIEYDLEQLGIPLIAADEPIMRSARTGRIEKKAGMVLLRRAKQGVAEWYVLEMLEKSRNGIEIHTNQGYNVGNPCTASWPSGSGIPCRPSELRDVTSPSRPRIRCVARSSHGSSRCGSTTDSRTGPSPVGSTTT